MLCYLVLNIAINIVTSEGDYFRPLLRDRLAHKLSSTFLVPIDHMPAEMNLIFDLSTDTVEPLYSKVLGVTNDFLLPQYSKIY